MQNEIAIRRLYRKQEDDGVDAIVSKNNGRDKACLSLCFLNDNLIVNVYNVFPLILNSQ